MTVGRRLHLSRNKGLYTGFIYSCSICVGLPEREKKNKKLDVFMSARQHNLTLSLWEQTSNRVWRWQPCRRLNFPTYFFSNSHPLPTTFQLPVTPKHPILLIWIHHLVLISYFPLFSLTHTTNNVCFGAINAAMLLPFFAMHIVYEYLKVSGGI